MILSTIEMIWTLTSLLVAGVCTICLLQPCWIIHPLTFSSFGLCSYCLNPGASINPKGIVVYRNPGSYNHVVVPNPYGAGPHCEFYGHAPGFGSLQLEALPSGAWKAACVLYAGGCAVFCLTAMVSVLATCLPDQAYRIRTVRGVAWIQAGSVGLMVLSLLVFPAALDTPQARQVCGPRSRTYYGDQCQIGWAYMLAVMGTALAVFCPLLARYVDLQVCEPIVDVPRRRIEHINKQLMDFV